MTPRFQEFQQSWQRGASERERDREWLVVACAQLSRF